MGWYGENGLEIYCENGLLAEQDECPCGCPPFEGRSIIYVDKHASGTGDGSSWTDAYTDIQTAINAHPKKEIQIQGHGESDAYPAGVTLVDCVYLKGVDSMWIDGVSYSLIGIDGLGSSSTKLEDLKIKRCSHDVRFCYDSLIENCQFFEAFAGVLDSSGSILDCYFEEVSSGVAIYTGNILGCTASNIGTGFQDCDNSILTNCVVDASIGIPTVGFGNNTNSTHINCIASGCWSCGFGNNTNSSFVGCTDSNNCQSGLPTCTPSNPNYNCDTV